MLDSQRQQPAIADFCSLRHIASHSSPLKQVAIFTVFRKKKDKRRVLSLSILP